MKLLFLVFMAVFAHIQCMSDEQRELLKKWHLECFEETKVSPDLVLKLKTGDWRLDNKQLKKWTLCLLKKYDLMSEEGVFRLDNAMSMVPNKALKPPKSHVVFKRERNSEKKDEENDILAMAMFLASFAILL